MPPGRPTVFCEEVCNKILETLEQGYDEKQACGNAGVGYSTYLRWKSEASNHVTNLRWKSEASNHVTNTPKKCFFEKVDVALSKRDYVLEAPMIDAIVKDKDVKTALRYKELRIRAEVARNAKEAQDKIIDAQIVEITDDDVEWINHVSNYQQ